MKRLAIPLLAIAGCALASGLTLTETAPEGAVLELSAPQPEFKTLSIRGEYYVLPSMEGAENLADFSMPRVPVYRAWLEIPCGAEVQVSISDETVESISGPAWPIQPGIESAPKSQPRDSFIMEMNDEVYETGVAYPHNWVRVTYAGEMRGRNLALVEVMPLRWSAASGTCDLLAEATIELDFVGGDLARTYQRAERMYAPPFERMLSGMVENYGIYEQGCDTPPAPYLIIGHEDFVTTGMDDFVAWKESIGFDVTMVDLSVTGTQDTDIQAYIRDAIETWPNPPQYVLLVGDVEYLTEFDATQCSGTDLYFACLDDGGYFPDAFLGRFSVQETGQAVMMGDRVINYEENVSGSTPWVQNTCWIASNDNYDISEGTHNYCIDNFFAPMGYTYDKVYPNSGGNASDVIASLNSGASMLTFSGHGSQTSWGDMSFGQSDFNQLTNSDMLPGVFSHSCLTGAYNDVTTAWCETWTRTPGRGGLWFFGSVPSTYWDEDDIQERAEMEWFLDDGVHWAKGFCNGGLLAVYEYYSGGGRSQYYWEGYNLMGDPSVQMAVWGVTGIEDQSGDVVRPSSAISVPNPVRASAMVTITGDGPATLDVYDVTGRLVSTPFRGSVTGSHSVSWSTAGLTPGVYFLHLDQAGQVSTARVMVIE